jgi:hypothetical protein
MNGTLCRDERTEVLAGLSRVLPEQNDSTVNFPARPVYRVLLKASVALCPNIIQVV